MDHQSAFRISASGMAVERLRLEVTAANIANMHSAGVTPAQTYRPLRVIGAAVPLTFSQQFVQQAGVHAGAPVGGGVVASAQPQVGTPRMVHEPGHPYADAKGFVAYPAVDHTTEMLTMNTALRAYEANVAAMNAAKTMAARTLDIGGQ